MTNVLTIVGARPQFIKAAPLSAQLRAHATEILVHTGQHYDDEMSDVFFRQLGIPAPNVNLGVGSGSHAQQTAAMLTAIEALIQQHEPDWVLVYGDTNSTLAGALAAAKVHVPVAHVEAGLRSYNRAMPEEINRVMTDHLSTRLFCPTPTSVENLASEGIVRGVTMTGDIMVDAIHHFLPKAQQQATIHADLGLTDAAPYAVMTIHRPANTDNSTHLAAIMAAADSLDMPVIFPAHPRTVNAMQRDGIVPQASLRRITPLGYLDMLALVNGANVLITDSGGLQKEAYVMQTPCVTIRTETEWVETVESGWNRLCAPHRDAIHAAVAAAQRHTPEAHPAFYGDGSAAAQMVAALVDNA